MEAKIVPYRPASHVSQLPNPSSVTQRKLTTEFISVEAEIGHYRPAIHVSQLPNASSVTQPKLTTEFISVEAKIVPYQDPPAMFLSYPTQAQDCAAERSLRSKLLCVAVKQTSCACRLGGAVWE